MEYKINWLNLLCNRACSTAALFSHRVFKFVGCQLYYHSRCGVKVLNRTPESQSHLVLQSIQIDPSNVCFFIDGLRNEYTLTGKTIVESPHFYLIKGIVENNMTLCQDYYNREAMGALDGRFELKITAQTQEQHKRSTFRNLELINNDCYKHPQVTIFNGCYYALDGKHRLAMASYLKKNIECDLIPLDYVLCTQYINNIHKKMLKNPQNYSINLNLFSKMAI